MKLKKITALLLALLFVSALTACDTKSDVSQDNHLDWVYVAGSANDGALTENGYYDRINGVLNYIDLATGKSVVLCQKVGCKHEHGLEDEERCDAELELTGNRMLFDNDTLYYADRNTLYSRNATGGELKELGMLAKELVKENKRVTVFISAICNGYLYYSGTISEIEEDKSGSGTSIVKATDDFIGRYNLSNRKDEILVHQEINNYGQDIQFVAARENGVIYLYEEGIGPAEDWEDVDAKKRLAAQQKTPVYIKHLNLVTGETTTLLSTTFGNTHSVSGVENGKLFYIKSIDGTYELHSYDLATGKDTAFYKEEASPNYYGKGFWLLTKWLDAQGKTAERHIHDANTAKTFPCELSGHFWTMARSAHGMVMLYDNHSTISGYFFLSYDSLADGLQESDLKFLYSNS